VTPRRIGLKAKLSLSSHSEASDSIFFPEPPPDHGIHSVGLPLGFDEIRQPGSTALMVKNTIPSRGTGETVIAVCE